VSKPEISTQNYPLQIISRDLWTDWTIATGKVTPMEFQSLEIHLNGAKTNNLHDQNFKGEENNMQLNTEDIQRSNLK